MNTYSQLALGGALVLIGCGGGGTSSAAPPTSTPSAATITITPSQLTLLVGGSGALIAVVRDVNGSVLPQAQVAWATQAPSIATVTAGGSVTGVSAGTAVVTATSGSALASATVLVTAPQPTIATLTVAPSQATTTVGGTHPFTVVAQAANGLVLPTPSNITWTSSAPTVASITAGGLATGVAAGVAMISASSGTLIAAPAMLTVTDPSGRCGDIASVSTFELGLILSWTHVTTVNGHRISGDHGVTLIDDWKQVQTGDPNLLQWRGPIGVTQSRTVGKGNITDDDVNTRGQPVTTATMRAQGAVLPAVGGLPLPDGVLYVDLTNCKFRFELTPWLLATETDHGGQRQMGELPMGTLLTTWHAIGPWRAPGRNQNSIQLIDHPVPVHSVSWLAALGGPLDVYIAGGYGPLMFATGGASEAAAGTANLVVGFSAK